jgi:hypothetical protein
MMEGVNSTMIYCKNSGKCHNVLQYNNNNNNNSNFKNLPVREFIKEIFILVANGW